MMAVETPDSATHEIAEANAAMRLHLPFADTDDFDDARRRWSGSLSVPVIRATDGRVVWNADAYAFLEGERRCTVNPSLWPQSQLAPIHGLFEVREGICQVRDPSFAVVTP